MNVGYRDCVLWATLSLFVNTGRASAYCRLTTEQPATSMCPEPCVRTGIPVAWRQFDIRYTLNEGLIPDLPDDDARRILRASFDAWNSATCAEGPMTITLREDTATTPIATPNYDDDKHVIVYHGQSEWKALHPFRDRAFALTQVWFRTDTGEIVGADMELNGGLGQFTECPEPEGCAPGGQIDLGNVVTHEVGHFLGLAHSDQPDATMSCDAEPWAINKRTLSDDDITGICSVYAGSNAAQLLEKRGGKKPSGKCSLGAGAIGRRGPAPWPWLWAFALCPLLLARRRMSGRQSDAAPPWD